MSLATFRGGGGRKTVQTRSKSESSLMIGGVVLSPAGDAVWGGQACPRSRSAWLACRQRPGDRSIRSPSTQGPRQRRRRAIITDSVSGPGGAMACEAFVFLGCR